MRDSLSSINLRKCQGAKTFAPVRVPLIVYKITDLIYETRSVILVGDEGLEPPTLSV